MALHLVDDPLALMQQWHRALAVDGFLMFSTLGPGSMQGLRQVYARLGWPTPHAPFVDMHDLGDMLVHTGFADPVMDQEILTLTWPDADALLGELRTLGGNADPGRVRQVCARRDGGGAWARRCSSCADPTGGCGWTSNSSTVTPSVPHRSRASPPRPRWRWTTCGRWCARAAAAPDRAMGCARIRAVFEARQPQIRDAGSRRHTLDCPRPRGPTFR
jgi:hypothetical protein